VFIDVIGPIADLQRESLIATHLKHISSFAASQTRCPTARALLQASKNRDRWPVSH